MENTLPLFYETLHIAPLPKGRPRFTRQGHAFTPAKTRQYEKELQTILRSKWRGKPLLGALCVSIAFFIERPKSNKTPHPVSQRVGDCDNLAKAVLDAANGILFEDDSQVVRLSASKQWGNPRIVVVVREVTE